jgi:tRNA(Ile)-lysidine synthase
MECEVKIMAQVPDQDELHLGDVQFVDGDKLTFPLELRSLRPGDRFQPLGAPGSKKVGDFLTDKKAEAFARGRIALLCDGRGIIAVLGFRIDERVRLDRETKQVLRLSWRSC